MQQLISKLNLREEVGAEHQTYALGLKEVWQVDSSKHKEGLVEHLVGYPLDSWTYGGAFIYHMEDNKVSLGFVVALDYWNTYLNPYQEFQRFKSHSYVRRLLEEGECLEYGARALNEGNLSVLQFQPTVQKQHFIRSCHASASARLHCKHSSARCWRKLSKCAFEWKEMLCSVSLQHLFISWMQELQ